MKLFVLFVCFAALAVSAQDPMGMEGDDDEFAAPPPAGDFADGSQASSPFSPSLSSQPSPSPYNQDFLEDASRFKEEPAAESPAESAPAESSPAAENQESSEAATTEASTEDAAAASLNEHNKPGYSMVSPGMKPVAVQEPAPSDEDEEEEIKRIVGGKLTEAEKHFGEIIFDEDHDKEVLEAQKAKATCAEGADCVTAEESAPGFKPGDESPEASMSQSMMEIKDALIQKAKVVTKEQAWLDETTSAIDSQNKKMERVKAHVEDERKAIQALLEKRADMKKQEKQKELEARLKFASDQLVSLKDALKQVKDREDAFFETKETLSDKIGELEENLAKLKGKTVQQLKAEAKEKELKLKASEKQDAMESAQKEKEEERQMDDDAQKEIEADKKEEKKVEEESIKDDEAAKKEEAEGKKEDEAKAEEIIKKEEEIMKFKQKLNNLRSRSHSSHRSRKH